ncbi:hypothetical protein PIROE2DRAFT_62147 [Piromyces sp. E2]|nr:hypothetical protein PIROE2DRAFT_62147 [Piromyces sp. E2]|eukprot:OUM62023.1 hypothetical protein PIROE2DRAFT_62147 [Piromyces sp. E2]
MINTKDLRAFTKQILNEDDDDENLNDYDVNHLDYQYIEKCTNIKELKKLLKILKSGKEGYFLQMEDAIQKKLEELDPSLIKEPLPKKEDIANELNDWVNMLKKKDENLKNNNNKAIFTKKDNKNVLTNELTFNTEEPFEKISTKKSNTNNSKKNNNSDERIKSTDYRKWDLYNVEEEVKKLDEKDEKLQEKEDNHDIERKKHIENYARRLNKEKHIPAVSDEIKQKSTEELRALAEIEKNKGNDCYKSKDYEEALIYYTRSLDLLEMPNVYTNRALVNLKMARFAEAENDATESLRMNDPRFNFKAYLRRGESYSRRARYREAINDFSEALKLDPNNKEAENFLIKAQQNYLDVEGELAEKLDIQIKETKKPSKPKKKMVIKEVDEINDDDILLNTEKTVNNDNKIVEDTSTKNINKYKDNENSLIEEITIKKEERNNKKSSKILINEINDGDDDDDDTNIINKKGDTENSFNENGSKKENIKYENIDDKHKITEINTNLNENEENTKKSEAKLIIDNTDNAVNNDNINTNIVNNNDDNNVDKNNNDVIKLNKIMDIEDINILSEEEEEESSIYNDESDNEDKDTHISNKNKMKFEKESDRKSKMKSYIDSLKFYDEYDDVDDNMCNFNEEEIRAKLEKLNELKNYMRNKFDLLNNNEEDNEDDILILDEEEEEEEEINNKYNVESDNEEINYMEFLKSKEKERRELYEKTINNNKNEQSTDNDISDNEDEDDLDDIYNSEDEDEILNIINSQLRRGDLNDNEKNYISKLLKNRRSQASLGSDNSDFENYDIDSN